MSKIDICPFNAVCKNLKQRAARFVEFLDERYPDARCSLNYKNPYELIVATILSAQCTDKRVNMVTGAFFKKYPVAEELAEAEQKDVEEIIRSTGFYSAKARHLINMAKKVVEAFDGVIPQKLAYLTTLDGVGRKTANVVLGNAYGIPAMVVDTHMIRVSNRLRFTKSQDPAKIEQDLMRLIPEKKWVDFSHQVIMLGRDLCSARAVRCKECLVSQGT